MIKLIHLQVTALLLTALTSFGQTVTRVSGVFTDLPKGARVRLMQTSEEGYVDSLITSDSTFAFNVPVDQRELYIIEFFVDANRYGYPVFLHPGDPVYLQIASRFARISFSGSAIADDQHDFYQLVHSVINKIAQLDKQLENEKDTAQTRALQAEKLTVVQQSKTLYANWIKEHNNSPYALAVMIVFMGDSPLPVLEELYSSITDDAKEDSLLPEVLSDLFDFKRMTEPARQE